MTKTSPIGDNKKTINGYDGWEVRDAGRILRKAEEIKDGDSKFLKTVLKEMDREAANTEKTADIIKKTSAKLKSTFREKR